MQTYIVIPAYNPNDKLYVLCSALKDKVQNIVLVNDGSAESIIFERLAADFKEVTVLTHSENRGKGEALKTAFSHILKNTEADGVVTCDADGQHRVSDILKCMEALEKAPSSLVLGCRNFNWNDMPLKSRIGNKHTIKCFHKATGVYLNDTQTGLRGLGRALIEEAVMLEGSRFEYEMNMLTTFAFKHEIIQVPIESVYSEDSTKHSSFKPLKDSFKVLRAMRRAIRRNRAGNAW